MKEDKYIGTEYISKQGSKITVHEKSSEEGKYICTCSVCSKDEELWPYGSIVNSGSNIRRKGNGCGCMLSPKWTQRQYEVLMQRKCSERGWLFLGLKPPFLGSKTLIKMQDTVTRGICETVSINNIDKIVGFPTTRYVRTSEHFSKSLKNTSRRIRYVLQWKVLV